MNQPLSTAEFDWRRVLSITIACAITLYLFSLSTITFLPEVFLDMDPRLTLQGVSLQAQPHLGPDTMLAWTVMGVGLSMAALLVSACHGIEISKTSAVLVLLGLVAALWHLNDSATDRYTLASWLTGVCLGFALLHLGQIPIARTILTAGLVCMLLPWALDAMWYLSHEHPRGLQTFREQAEQVALARGWAMDSPQFVIYQRRVMAPDVTGPFGLSNVFGSLVAAMTVLSAALMLPLANSNSVSSEKRWIIRGLMLVLIMLGLWITWMTKSKGAIAGLLAGFMLLSFVAIVTRKRWPNLPISRRSLLIGLLVLMVLGVHAILFARWSMGPPADATGERSLLFRAYYLEAGLRTLLHTSPSNWLLGLGIDGLSEAYLIDKNPLNPESVVSLHHQPLDTLISLGLLGLSWVLLPWVWLGRGATGLMRGKQNQLDGNETNHDESSDTQATWFAPRTMMLLAAVGFGTWMAVEWSVMWWLPTIPRLAVAGWWAICMAGLLAIGLSHWQTQLGLWLAGAALLIHGQIEMTWFMSPSVILVWALLGLAGASSSNKTNDEPANEEQTSTTKTKRWPWALGLAPAVLALVFLVPAALDQAKIETHKHDAALAMQAGQLPQAIAAMDHVAEGLFDPRLMRWQIALRLEGRQPQWNDARAVLTQYEEQGHAPASLYRLRLAIDRHDPRVESSELLELYDAILQRSPYALKDHLGRADLLASLNDPRAMQAYQRVLELHELHRLDPATQLNAANLERVQNALDGKEPSKPVVGP